MSLRNLSTLAHAGRRRPPRRVASGDLLDLTELQLDRRRPTEDRYPNLEPRPLLVHLLDMALEGRKGAISHPHLLADLEGDHRLGPFHALSHLMEDAHRLVVGDGR